MVGITERNQQRLELANTGFTLRYIDEWQAKTTLYRHKPSYTLRGEISEDVGSAVTGVPGNPDYVLRKSKIGLFPWKPGNECLDRQPIFGCQWCRERAANAAAPETFKASCDLCTFEAESTVRQAALNKLKGHVNKLHN